MPGCTSCKWDGGRFQVRKHGNAVRFYSRYGAEYTERLPQMCRAFAELPARSVVLDGELVLIDPRGGTHFWRLMAQMHTNHPTQANACSWRSIFDLPHRDRDSQQQQQHMR